MEVNIKSMWKKHEVSNLGGKFADQMVFKNVQLMCEQNNSKDTYLFIILWLHGKGNFANSLW